MPDLAAFASSPFLYGGLAFLGWLVWFIEKVADKNGPFTRLVAAWQEREYRKLVREKKVREARIALERLEESAVVRGLRGQINQLSADMAWLIRERTDQIERDKIRARFDRAMVQWINGWLPRARAQGLTIPDPPELADLAPLLEVRDEALPDEIRDLVTGDEDDEDGHLPPRRRWTDHLDPEDVDTRPDMRRQRPPLGEDPRASAR